MRNRIPTEVVRSGARSQKLTREVLEFYGPKCWLQLPGCTGLATTKDHVVPVDHGGTDAIENLRPACGPCNSKRRNLAISGIGGINVHMLIGPVPGALTARATQLAQDGDLVIDLARIRDALAATTGSSTPHLERVAGRAFKSAMDQALRLAARCSVIIVHPMPTAKQLQQYARLRYHIETIDAGRATVEAAAAQTANPHTIRQVAQWYALYPEGVASVERVKAHRPTTAFSRTAQPLKAAKPSRAW